MSLEFFISNSFNFFIGLFAANMACFFFILGIHFFVPKPLLHAYFREPYFSPFEVEFFTGFPYAYMRTTMFMRLAGWPDCGKKRGIPANAHELTPVWFQVVSRVFIRIFLVLFSLLMTLIITLSIWLIWTGQW